MKTDRTGNIVAKQQTTTSALRGYAHLLDSRLHEVPVEIKEMISYIHDHLFEPALSVEAIRTACRARNNNVTTRFRQTMGEGIWEYVVKRRLEAATAVLSSSEVNIYILAAAVGYTEEAFSKMFKSAYGCSPLQYHRDNYRGNGQENVTREMDKKKGQIEMKTLLYIATVVLNLQFACKENPVDTQKPENRSPVISSVVVFPEVVRPSDSLIVVCSAADPDEDTLVYDWITSGVVRIKGANANEHWLYHTRENTRIFYAPESTYVSTPQDTFWIQCNTRDVRGGEVGRLIAFVVTRN